MNIKELIEHAGVDCLKVQRIDLSLTAAKTNKKGETTISFLTNQITTGELMHGGDDETKVGYVVWIPKNKIPFKTPG